jgi:hypothetical protein
MLLPLLPGAEPTAAAAPSWRGPSLHLPSSSCAQPVPRGVSARMHFLERGRRLTMVRFLSMGASPSNTNTGLIPW